MTQRTYFAVMLDRTSPPITPAAGGLRPADHPPVISGLIGVLLVNLGTPDATDYWSMRRYLKEFLSDRRVIETPRLLWWPLLNLVILSRRPQRKGIDYASIWNRELDEGPLKTITRAQADNLFDWVAKGALGESGARLRFDWAMRYGNPSIAGGIARLKLYPGVEHSSILLAFAPAPIAFPRPPSPPRRGSGSARSPGRTIRVEWSRPPRHQPKQ